MYPTSLADVFSKVSTDNAGNTDLDTLTNPPNLLCGEKSAFSKDFRAHRLHRISNTPQILDSRHINIYKKYCFYRH